MGRAEALDLTLRYALKTNLSVPSSSGRLSDSERSTKPFDQALSAIRAFFDGDFRATLEFAKLALANAADADTTALARAAAGLAIAGNSVAAPEWAPVGATSKDDPLFAALADNTELSQEFEPVILSLLAEASIACARLDLAAKFIDRAGKLPPSLFSVDHPYLTVMRVQRIRILAFQGQITSAKVLSEESITRAKDPLSELFAKSAAALICGNAAESGRTRSIIQLVERSGVTPHNAVSRGCYLLAAFGAVAISELEVACRLVLKASGDPSLTKFTIIDRTLCFELLISSAARSNDLDAATAWLARLVSLEDHPIAASTVARARSRVALLSGDADLAEVFARKAADLATVEGRQIELAEAEILCARARIARSENGKAAWGLNHFAEVASNNGHLAAVRSANRELRKIGRRLNPKTSSKLDGLSNREQEVARLIAQGQSNEQIAAQLFISPHTVRIHVSRVLHSFGVATRIGVVSEFASLEDRAVRFEVPELTARQFEIAQLVATGSSNSKIAEQLNISVKTVERHVTDILRRWNIDSRRGIVALLTATNTAQQPQAASS